MSDMADARKSWTQSVQADTAGKALDAAIGALSKQIGTKVIPDECIVVGPFPAGMRPEALFTVDAVRGVWDITIRWY